MRERADPATPNPLESASVGPVRPEPGGAIAITADGRELAAAFREVFGRWRLQGGDIVARPIAGGQPGD